MKDTIEYIRNYLAYDNLYYGITEKLAEQLANDLVRDIQAGAVPNLAFKANKPVTLTDLQREETIEALKDIQVNGFCYADILINATNAIESGKIPHLGVIR